MKREEILCPGFTPALYFHTKMSLPTGNFSNHVNVVFTRKFTEMCNDCCCYDLLIKKNNVTPVSLVLFIFLSCKQPLSCATIAFPGSSVIIGVKTLPAGCINQYTCCFTGRERMKEKLKGRLTTTSSIGIGNGSFCRQQSLISLTTMRTASATRLTTSSGT